MEEPKVKTAEDIYILKKDWPPFPKGTEFKLKKGLAEYMLCSPTFGETMPNGQKANGMIPRHFSEYIRHFDYVGGFDVWFDKKFKTKEEELQSHITKLEAENFKLAAYQCDKPYGDDYGNKRCTYQDRILELEARVKELEEALVEISGFNTSATDLDFANSKIILMRNIALNVIDHGGNR